MGVRSCKGARQPRRCDGGSVPAHGLARNHSRDRRKVGGDAGGLLFLAIGVAFTCAFGEAAFSAEDDAEFEHPGTTDARYIVVPQAPASLSDHASAYQSENPAQGYRIVFTDTGVHMTAANAGSAAWKLDWSFARFGYPDDLMPIGPASLAAGGNRIDYQRPGAPDEQYVNAPQGLLMTMAASGPPARDASLGSSPLVLDLAMSGDLEPRIVGWTDAPGPFNVYRGLRSGPGAWAYNHACFEHDTFGPSQDGSQPGTGDAWYYLVTRKAPCGESIPGRDSLGIPIPNPLPCP